MTPMIGFGLLMINAASTVLATLPPNTLMLNVTRVTNQAAYGVEMEVGTPPQKMRVIVDSGSPFLGLAGAHSNWCQLAKKAINDFRNELNNQGVGDYIQDTVRVGGQTYSGISLGMVLDYQADYPPPDIIPGLVGVVPFCYGVNGNCTAPATTFEQHLLAKGYIRRHTVAFYLGPDEPSATGQILFGAVDRAKQDGVPVTFPVISVFNPITNQAPNVVSCSSYSLERSVQSATPAQSAVHFNISTGSYGIVDSGNPNWALPDPVWKSIADHFQLKHGEPKDTYFPVDCKYRQSNQNNATLVVGFDNDRLKIRIPLERLVTQISPGHCGTAVEKCGDDGLGCSFGDPFMRSAYTLFDFDNKTVTMSNVKYTNATDIVAA